MFHGLIVSGSRAYAATSDGLHIFDVSNPANPVDVAHTNNVVGVYPPSGVALSADYIYLANQSDGLRIYSLAGPQFKIDPPSAGQLLVSWPSNYYIFSLQQNSDLNSRNWLEVTNIPVVISNRNQVVLSPNTASGFYRLQLQP